MKQIIIKSHDTTIYKTEVNDFQSEILIELLKSLDKDQAKEKEEKK